MLRVLTFLALFFNFVLFPFRIAAAETIEHRGVTFWIYKVDPGTTELEIHLSPKKGNPNKFLDLRERLRKKGREMVFATNAGIFEGNFLPTGLHVSEGKTIVPLNRDDFVKEREGQFTPNFYLKPNGVFLIDRNKRAVILETSEYVNRSPKPVLASQSGPLLVQNEKIHPVLEENSTSERYRNGVGVTPDGKVIFACSILDREKGMINLYRFAELFRDRLGCPDALYLDGDISYTFIRGVTPPLQDPNWFGGIFVVTESLP
ncbi:MAG: phosphodiester glycosidase family protein [Verrucomicrobiota bacterium]